MTLRHLSLRARLVLLVALLFAAFALFFLAFFPARMDAQAQHWMLGRAMGMAQLLASATEPALDFGDALNGQSHLEALRSTPEATFGLLLREDGTPLASWNPERAQALPMDLPEGARILGQEVVARVNILTRGGQHGALLLGFSLAEMRRESQDTLRLAATVSALIFGFGLLAAFGLGTLLVRPLGHVTRVALRISEGELGALQELDLTRRDETGTLASALSRMLRRLYEQKALIESQSEASSEGILTVSETGALLTHNRRLLQLWNLSPERLEGKHLEELFQSLTPQVVEPEALRRLADLTLEPSPGGHGRARPVGWADAHRLPGAHPEPGGDALRLGTLLPGHHRAAGPGPDARAQRGAGAARGRAHGRARPAPAGAARGPGAAHHRGPAHLGRHARRGRGARGEQPAGLPHLQHPLRAQRAAGAVGAAQARLPSWSPRAHRGDVAGDDGRAQRGRRGVLARPAHRPGTEVVLAGRRRHAPGGGASRQPGDGHRHGQQRAAPPRPPGARLPTGALRRRERGRSSSRSSSTCSSTPPTPSSPARRPERGPHQHLARRGWPGAR